MPPPNRPAGNPSQFCRPAGAYGTTERKLGWRIPGATRSVPATSPQVQDLIEAALAHRVALKIRAAIAGRNWSQSQYARTIGVDDQSVNRLLRGE